MSFWEAQNAQLYLAKTIYQAKTLKQGLSYVT
jgi:hypothetical protein